MKVFYCGLCRKENRVAMIRPYFRKHLKEEHGVKNELFNWTGIKDDNKKTRKRYIIEVEL